MTDLPAALREELRRLEDELAMDPRHAKISRIRALLETYPESTPAPPPAPVQHRPAPPVFWRPEEDEIIEPLVKAGRHTAADIEVLLPRLPGRNAAQIDGRIRRLRVKAKKRPDDWRRLPMQPIPADPPTMPPSIRGEDTTSLDTEKEVMPHTPAETAPDGRHNATAPAVAGADPPDTRSQVNAPSTDPPANLAELEARYTTDPIYAAREQPAAMGAYLSGGFEALKLGPRR